MKEDKHKDGGIKTFNFEKSNVLTSSIMGLTHLRSNIGTCRFITGFGRKSMIHALVSQSHCVSPIKICILKTKLNILQQGFTL
jgi:hypothetical protein